MLSPLLSSWNNHLKRPKLSTEHFWIFRAIFLDFYPREISDLTFWPCSLLLFSLTLFSMGIIDYVIISRLIILTKYWKIWHFTILHHLAKNCFLNVIKSYFWEDPKYMIPPVKSNNVLQKWNEYVDYLQSYGQKYQFFGISPSRSKIVFWDFWMPLNYFMKSFNVLQKLSEYVEYMWNYDQKCTFSPFCHPGAKMTKSKTALFP